MSRSARKMPSKMAIAQYWIQWEMDRRENPPFGFFDWGEPACMRCGYWDESWDDIEPSEKHPYRRWNFAALERCHVVPRYLGGSDEVSNLVLMCHPCHARQPDSQDPGVTFEYMLHSTPYMPPAVALVIALAQQAGRAPAGQRGAIGTGD